MPPGQRTVIVQTIRDLLRTDDRFIDIAARLRVWDRGPSGPVPGEVLPRVYGGRYDSLLRKLVPVVPGTPPLHIVELSCHRGQLELLEHDGGGGVRRVLALGPPGGGKSYAAVTKAILLGLPGNRTIGLVAPTNDRRRTVWDYLCKIGEEHGWIAPGGVKDSKKEIRFVNNTVFQVVSGMRQSSKRGVTVQGRNWDAAVIDESQNVEPYVHTEIAFRGRLNPGFCVFETATNDPIPEFRQRVQQYHREPGWAKVLKYSTQSPWVYSGFYDEQRNGMTDRDYRERILLEEMPSETRTYYEYNPKVHVKRRLNIGDITAKTVADKYPRRRSTEYVIAQDFGYATNTSIILKAYLSADQREREWWAVDEVITRSTTAEQHAHALIKRGYTSVNSVVIGDPHHNQFSVDTPVHISDYRQFTRAGLEIHPASEHRISRKHRVAMMNTLLRDAHGVMRLFIATDTNGRPACPELARSLEFSENDPDGKPEGGRKDRDDISHASAAVGYGVYKWERIRGGIVDTSRAVDATE